MITKNELSKLIAKGYSLRDIAKFKGVSHTLVAKWCKKYKLNTVFSIYKPITQPSRKIFTNQDIDFYLDTSSVSFRSLKGKHKRSIPYSFMSLYNTKTKNFIFYFFNCKENQIKTKDIQIALNQIGIKPNSVFCVDSKHNKLAKVLKVTNIKGWSAKQNLSEKCFGLKAKIYSQLRFIQEVLGINKIEDFVNYPSLVLRTYVTILSRHGLVYTSLINDELRSVEKWLHQITN